MDQESAGHESEDEFEDAVDSIESPAPAKINASPDPIKISSVDVELDAPEQADGTASAVGENSSSSTSTTLDTSIQNDQQGEANVAVEAERAEASVAPSETEKASEDLGIEGEQRQAKADGDGDTSVEGFMAQFSEPQTVVLGGSGEVGGEGAGVPPPPVEEEMKFVVTNKDTGETFHIDDIDDQIAPDSYNLFPSRAELDAQQAELQLEQQKESSGRGKLSFSKVKGMVSRRGSRHKDGDPNTVDVQSNKKDKSKLEYSKLRLVQTIPKHCGPVWTAKFSMDGSYLCTAGQEPTVYVWQVAVAPGAEDSGSGSGSASSGGSAGAGAGASAGAGAGAGEAPIFAKEPIRAYVGHAADVIDVAWSRSNFILSASMDNTVKLWHVTRNEMLAEFKHSDYVTAIDFHPKEDRYFLSGCFDKKLRIWNIPHNRVVEWAQAPEMVTCARFNPSGKMAVAGLYHGHVIFYQTEGMRYYTQMHCANRRGPKRKGKKVTGIEFTPGDGGHVLVTTNDSRLRLFSVDDYSQTYKYKGLVNENMQIQAHFSQDGERIICGSDNGQVYIWETSNTFVPTGVAKSIKGARKDKNMSYEHYPATNSSPPIVTVAMFAPAGAYAIARQGVAGAGTESCRRFVVSAAYDGTISVHESEMV